MNTKKTNGVQIFVVYALAMFLCVFVLSRIFTPKTQALPETEPVDPPAQTEPAVTEPEPEPKGPVEDPADADNTWAMFLVNNENPVPQHYSDDLETEVVYSSWKDFYMDSRAAPYMKQMIADAEEDGIYLVVYSAYRSAAYQQSIIDSSVEDRMANRGMSEEEAYEDTLKEVTLPGCSEHQSGLAADILSDTNSDMDTDSFKDTKEYEWLTEHASEYGFILRYPQGKQDVTGIIYEPWHFRFVGVYYAKLLTEQGLTLEEFFAQQNWLDEDGKAVYHICPEEPPSSDDMEEVPDIPEEDVIDDEVEEI